MEELNLLTRGDIINSIKDINKKSLVEDAVVYKLHFDGKYYSPLQVVNHAYSFKTIDGNDVDVYNIKEAIRELNRLDFEVIIENDIWKFGCNWGGNAPSFFNVVQNRKVVIDRGGFLVGDLILVTEGFTVRALARIKSDGDSLYLNKNLNELFGKYGVVGDVNYYEVELYELPQKLVFKYELQQGIVKVRKESIRYKAIDLWHHRNEVLSDIEFYNLKRSIGKEQEIVRENYPYFGLRDTDWDDYGYRTTFNLLLFKSRSDVVDLGYLKIFQIEKKITELPRKFTVLPSNFCSLGVEIEYYKNIKDLFPVYFEKILDSLRDIAYRPEIRNDFIDHDGVKVSLLRSSESLLIVDEFETLFVRSKRKKEYKFSFQGRIGNAEIDHKVDFHFNSDSDLITRIYCIIGKNATGKTKYLSMFVNKLINDKEEGKFIPARPRFSKVISASFSFFDKFKIPEKVDANYTFIGVRNYNEIITESDYSKLIWEAYSNLVQNKKKSDIWIKAISFLLEKEYLGFDLDELSSISRKKDFIEITEDIFSSGQNIAFQFVTRLIESIEYNSILVFDEPEMHLHPNMISRLVKTINSILEDYNSFCIMSTHSPIILQEFPKKVVKVFDRTSNIPRIYSPVIECFGENLSEISNLIFHVADDKELYRNQLDKLIQKNYSYDKILKLFDNKLSMNARIYIKTILKK